MCDKCVGKSEDMFQPSAMCVLGVKLLVFSKQQSSNTYVDDNFFTMLRSNPISSLNFNFLKFQGSYSPY